MPLSPFFLLLFTAVHVGDRCILLYIYVRYLIFVGLLS